MSDLDAQKKVYEYISIIDCDTSHSSNDGKVLLDLDNIKNNCESYIYENLINTAPVENVDSTYISENNIIVLYIYTDSNKYDPSNQYQNIIELNNDLMSNILYCEEINKLIKGYIRDYNITTDMTNFIRSNFNNGDKKIYIHLKFNKNTYYPKEYDEINEDIYGDTIIKAIRSVIINEVLPNVIKDETKYEKIKNLLEYTE